MYCTRSTCCFFESFGQYPSMPVELTSRISHENLVSMFGHCCELNERILIYEYMPKGALQDHLYGVAASKFLSVAERT